MELILIKSQTLIKNNALIALLKNVKNMKKSDKLMKILKSFQILKLI